MTTTTNKTNNNQGNIMNKSFILNSAIFSSTLAEETQNLIKAEEKELLTKMSKNKGVLETWMEGSEKWTAFSESKVIEHALASVSDVNQINFKNFKYLKSLEDYLNFVKKDGNKHSHPKINEDNVVDIIFKNANNYGTGYGILKNTSVDVRTYIWTAFSESKVIEHALASVSDVNQINFKNFKYLKSLEDYLNFVKKDGNEYSHPKINEDNVVLGIIFKNVNDYGTGYGILKNTSVDVRTYINLGTERIVSRIYTISKDVIGEVYIVG